MATIEQLNIPYDDFVLNTVINPQEFDDNNAEIQEKTNQAIAQINQNTTDIEDLETSEAEASARLDVNETDIDSLEAEDTLNKARISTNEADIDLIEQQIQDLIVGEIPSGSIGLDKQAPEVKTGLLANLSTSDKTTIVDAINENVSSVQGITNTLDENEEKFRQIEFRLAYGQRW